MPTLVEVYEKTGTGNRPLAQMSFEVPPHVGDLVNVSATARYRVSDVVHTARPGTNPLAMEYQVLVQRA